MKNAPTEHASLSWNEQGTPVSRTFNDVYFSNQNGLEETRYVFLTGNQLPVRFLNHPRELFVVAETGFGTALNFLTLWQAFDHYRQQTPGCRVKRLHFISCEKFPLTISDMQKVHAAWPELAPWSRELLSKWPEALPGCHRLLLANGQVTLDLWYGDINDIIHTFDDTLQQQVDAWFLDGFAPAKNPTMWTPELFDCMARLGRAGTTLATFTAAGFVRRGLQKAGFALRKRKGFGRKREMLTGELIATREAKQRAPWYARPAASEGDIAIIGGGLASGLLAQALLRRGRQITLYSAAQTPAEGASGNRQAALYPLLNPHDPALSRFFPTAFTFARRYYDAVALPYEHQWCGVTQLGWDKKSQQKIEKMLAMRLPATLAVAVNREQAEQLCGVKTGCGGIHYRSGGWLSPAELTASLLKDAQMKGMALHWQHKLTRLKKNAAGWQLLFADGRSAQHQNVVLASGASLNQLAHSEMLPVYAVAGQVSYIPTCPQLSGLQQVLCYDGYLTPVSPQYQTHCMGASYHRGSCDTRYRAEDQQNNALRLQRCLPEATWSTSVDVTSAQARCGVRCATRDHLPMIGALPDYDATLAQYAALSESQQQAATAPCHQGVFVLGALGSRGLCSGPLAAEVLAAQLCAEPIPLDCDTLAATSPNRYWLRKLLKGRPLR